MDKMFMRAFSRKRSATGSLPVYLNVYDLTPINGYAYWFGLGVYHSGVQVHGVEYAYGAHDRPASGIFEGEPRRCPGFRYRTSVLVGRTDLGPREVASLMDELAKEYAGNAYHLISKNCNHFCNDVCVRLTGEGIPGWVNRLANLGFLCNCVLPSAINGTAIRQKVPSASLSAPSGAPGHDEEKGRLMDAARKEDEEKLRRQVEEQLEEESNRAKAQNHTTSTQKRNGLGLGLAMRRSVSSSARCVPSFCFTSSSFSSKNDVDVPPLPPTTGTDPAAVAGSERGAPAATASVGGGGGAKEGRQRRSRSRSRRSASTSSSSRTSLVVAA